MENLETSLSIGMGMGFTSKAIVPLSPMLFYFGARHFL
jgi:hypothetical protein